MEYTISVTGYRPSKLWGYDMFSPEYERLRTLFMGVILNALKKYDVVKCRSGMALGADTVWAQAILLARKKYPERVKFIADIPFKTQYGKWPKESQAYWHKLVELADEQVIYSEEYTNWCMHERNHGLVDNANLLIAVWNGIIEKNSGTSGAVAYAIKKNVKILQIDPSDLKPKIYKGEN